MPVQNETQTSDRHEGPPWRAAVPDEKYVTDKDGYRTHVMLEIKTYYKLLNLMGTMLDVRPFRSVNGRPIIFMSLEELVAMWDAYNDDR